MRTARSSHHQRQRDGDRDVRHEVPVRSRTDRDEHEHRVDERGHERSERQLRAAVANEVAQHPRPELRRGEHQCHDRDREDDADHRDHGGGDRRQDLPGGVGGPADHPGRQPELAAVRGPVEGMGDGEQSRPPRRSRSSGSATGWCEAPPGATPTRDGSGESCGRSGRVAASAEARDVGGVGEAKVAFHGGSSGSTSSADQASRHTYLDRTAGLLAPVSRRIDRPALARPSFRVSSGRSRRSSGGLQSGPRTLAGVQVNRSCRRRS